MSSLLSKVRRSMRHLARPPCRILVGVSGGPDSQALLDALARLRDQLDITLVACGVDHGVRPEAAKELDFACHLAGEHQVPFEMVSVELDNDNVMAAARRARYRALRMLASHHGADRIAVAHTATDQVEGILLNLTRGSALRGARGMRPRRGAIVRPLLDVSRAQILDYLEEHGIRYATDPSNTDPRRARAQLRADVLPALRAINPEFEQAFVRFARAASDDESLLRQLARQELDTRLGLLDSLALAGIDCVPRPIAMRLVALWLRRHGLRSNQRGLATLLRNCHLGTGSLTVSGANVRVEAGRLWRLGGERYTEPLSAPGEVHIEPLGIGVRGAISEPETALSATSLADFATCEGSSVAFDCDSLHLDIKVRSWNEGDRFQPYGLHGHTKVGDLFTDRKIPRALRAVWPLVVHGDEVLWVVGLRRGNIAPVGVGTRRILTLTVEGSVPGW